MRFIKKSLLVVSSAVLAASILSLSGCNTVKGFGEDVSSGGQALSKAATKDEGKHKAKTKAESKS